MTLQEDFLHTLSHADSEATFSFLLKQCGGVKGKRGLKVKLFIANFRSLI
jgi:hypothetical protein